MSLDLDFSMSLREEAELAYLDRSGQEERELLSAAHTVIFDVLKRTNVEIVSLNLAQQVVELRIDDVDLRVTITVEKNHREMANSNSSNVSIEGMYEDSVRRLYVKTCRREWVEIKGLADLGKVFRENAQFEKRDA
ncbi:MAG: hypothetical protein ACXVXP_00390 [Mycobacteriaceae bacterium]